MCECAPRLSGTAQVLKSHNWHGSRPIWGQGSSHHPSVLPGHHSGPKFLENWLPCWEFFLPPTPNGWMGGPHPDPTPTSEAPLSPCGAMMLGSLDPLCAQMTPDFQGLVKHVHPARQVLISTFHPSQEARVGGARLLGVSTNCRVAAL